MLYLKDLKAWEDAIGQVLCCDCMDLMKIMPDKCVDLVLTDPPYGIGKNNKLRVKNNYDEFDDTPEYIISVVIPAIKKCISLANAVVLTPGSKNLCSYPQFDSFGTFYQPASVGIQRWGNMDSQPIIYYGKPYTSMFGSKCSYQLTEPPSCDKHPCSKPINAWKWLIKKCSDDDDLIFDPFAGSFTTALAAEQLGRRWIACDISPEYCKIGEKRLEKERSQLKLF